MFEPRIQEQGEKDRLAWLAQQERSKMQQAQKTAGKRTASDGREMPTVKRRKEAEGSQVEVLTLEDSEEEREDPVDANPSQAQAGHQSQTRLTSLPSISSTQTETPVLARLKSLPITVVGEVALSGTDSEEDDVQVNSTRI